MSEPAKPLQHQLRTLQAILSATDMPNHDRSISISTSMGRTTANFNILSSATLFITMTVPTQDKANNRTKYRPIERADGVVVLKHPYRPATSPAPSTPKFEKYLPTFVVSARITPRKEAAVLAKREEDFAHIGRNLLGFQSDGYGDLVDAGRGGHNDCSGQIQGLADFMIGLRQIQDGRQSAPMQRFLSEVGPWDSIRLSEI
ncbi:hypothetical protein BDU57DRAFT_515708 [Ampelomyces quisqualis]|uniref:Uncharacterized protein n=1 Tax=Ampelomyces quisqualis TaxID=50730 RepID=A0A6A5QKD3_AMPQU|nr:hypothetical protein BDU57DRAFT_515708 [Ampelomyces quisqualis]